MNSFDGKTIWEGLVHVFDLDRHPKAKRVYDGRRRSKEATSAGFLPCYVCARSNRPPMR
jgi:hypothetical protein